MTSIFLSYAHEDKTRAEFLAKALEAEGWSIFWDRTIPTGSTWRDHIGKALHEAQCVVVAWSASSVKSDWVHEEADEGRERKILVPVLLDKVKPPLGFRSIQAESLVEWNGSPARGEFRKLVRDIEQLLGPPPNRQSLSASEKAEAEPHQEAPAALQAPRQKTSPAETAIKQPAQRDRANEKKSESKDPGSHPAGVSKATVGSVVGLMLILGLALFFSIESDRPETSNKRDFLSANPGLSPDYDPTAKQLTPSETEFYLQKAAGKLEEGHIQSTLAGGGAIHYFKLVLQNEPENQLAILGLEGIIDDTLLEFQRAAEMKEQGAIERYSGVITEVCEQPVTAFRTKCSAAMQALSNILNTMHQGSMNAIRNIRG